MQYRSHHLEPSGSRAVLSAVYREPHFTMPDSKTSKAELRRLIRARRQGIDPVARHNAAHSLPNIIKQLPAWTDARRIALYLAADGEIDTTALAQAARKHDKELYLPVITPDNSLTFALWSSTDSLVRNRFDIPEPPASATRCPAAELDIIFMPLVAFDVRGGRLGMGGGFYDRTLSGICGPLLVGLAHTCQQVPAVPRDGWDISLDFIANESTLHCCQGQ